MSYWCLCVEILEKYVSNQCLGPGILSTCSRYSEHAKAVLFQRRNCQLPREGLPRHELCRRCPYAQYTPRYETLLIPLIKKKCFTICILLNNFFFSKTQIMICIFQFTKKSLTTGGGHNDSFVRLIFSELLQDSQLSYC